MVLVPREKAGRARAARGGCAEGGGLIRLVVAAVPEPWHRPRRFRRSSDLKKNRPGRVLSRAKMGVAGVSRCV